MAAITKTSIAVISVAAVLCSCNSEISHISQRKATANIRYVGQYNLMELPQLVDLQIEDRLVSGSFSGNDVKVEDAKSLAVANAIRTADADVLVEPIYDVTISDNTVNASVRGHPAHYKNFRKPPINERLYGSTSSLVNKKKPVVKEKEEEKEDRSYWGSDDQGSKSKFDNEELSDARTKEKEVNADEQNNEWQNLEDPDTKKTDIEKPEADDRSGKLKTPCFIISCAAVARETDARAQTGSLSRRGFDAAYLWIPDYDPAGKPLYKVYVGPYYSRSEAENVLPRVKAASSGAYVQQLK